LGEAFGDVLVDRGDAGDGVGPAGLRLEVSGACADALEDVGGALVGGAVLGRDEHLRRVTGLVGLDDLGVAHAVDRLDVLRGGGPGHGPLLLGDGAGVDKGDHGGVASRAELLRGDVVGDPVGGVGG